MVPEWQRQNSQENFYITNEFSAGFKNVNMSSLDGRREGKGFLPCSNTQRHKKVWYA